MEASGASASSRKRKSAALESTEQALTQASMLRPDCRAGEDDRCGVGEDHEGGVDHISALPDDVLGEIISLLSTKEGARTRILASRWHNLWCSAPLNLDGGYLRSQDFVGTVAVILSSHKGPGRRFRIPWHFVTENNKAALEACLQSPALDNLQELDLDLELAYSYCELGQLMPNSLFRFSHTLRVAQIARCTLSDVTVQGLHFPLLKQLGLCWVNISECSLNRMIDGCPALESLLIRSCPRGASCVRINSLCLRRIAVYNDNMVDEIIIESAPCLETLLHLNSTNDVHVFTKLLDTLGCTTNSIRLVFGSKGIQGLYIDSLATVVCTIKCLALNMPKLSLDMVIQVMGFFPCLEKLYIQCDKPGKKNLWRRKHRDLIKSLDLRLKKLVLSYYQGRNSDVDFVSFFVLNATMLESVTLVVKTNNKEFLAKQDQMLQLQNRASSGAQIRFTTVRGPSLWDIRAVQDLDLIDYFE